MKLSPDLSMCTYHAFFYHNKFLMTLLCAHTIPTYVPTIYPPIQLLVWLTAHFQTEKQKQVVWSYLLWIARTQWTQCVILGQLPSNVIPAMRQFWLSRSVKKGCCYAEGEDMTSHPSNTIEYAPNTAKLTSNSMNKTTLHMVPRVSNITVRTAIASL